jgi:hypothetical protein
LHRAELTTTSPAPLPMNGIWPTIRSYILWQHERGTLHYDIMVTLILIFVLFSPRVINFNDKPIARNAHPTEVTVTADAEGRLFYQIAASAVQAGDGRTHDDHASDNLANDDPVGDDQAVREQLLHIIEPISGAVSIVSYEAVRDNKGNVLSYKVQARRE